MSNRKETKRSKMAPDLTLYHSERACSLVVLCLLGDLDLPFKVVQMRMGPNGIESVDGTLDRAKYLQIHPMANVPALVVDGQAITETPAILSYIASLVPDKHLLGNTPLEQAWALSWMEWLAGSLHGRGFRSVFRPGRLTDDESAHAAIRTKGQAFVKECYVMIDERLAKSSFFPVSNHETVVDFYLIVFYIWGRDIGIDMATEYPAYARLFARMSEKEVVRNVDLTLKPGMVYVPEE
ncbi:hypothetical protein SCUCBS95973_002382 [Sporothrix curviconia]|uniref:Glutathione S-transferase n=1 Tax=Sporothrix curviconia TaxID=1260050 RepID=A0ABP0B6K2_9PEZI